MNSMHPRTNANAAQHVYRSQYRVEVKELDIPIGNEKTKVYFGYSSYMMNFQ